VVILGNGQTPGPAYYDQALANLTAPFRATPIIDRVAAPKSLNVRKAKRTTKALLFI
jgi:hypothetical protein